MAEEKKVNVFGTAGAAGLPQKTRSFWKWLLYIILAILLAVGGYFLYKKLAPRFQSTTDRAPVVSQPSVVPRTETTDTAPVPQAPLPAPSEANYQSENFRVGDISLGNESVTLLVEDTPEPLAIRDIRGEAFTEKNKAEVKLVISWKTNKLAKSEVSYSKGPGQVAKTVGEEDYTISHSVIIPALDQASTYYYTILTRDRFGNEITSDQHAVYTGSKSVSLFDLISGAIGDVFGWAVK
jgi:hypothetical protein